VAPFFRETWKGKRNQPVGSSVDHRSAPFLCLKPEQLTRIVTPERFQQISRIYHLALDQDPNQRGAFLDQSCGRDRDLRDRVELLLSGGKGAEAQLLSRVMQDAAQRLKDEPHTLVGKTIDNYRVLSLLGVGGMGEIYRALDVNLGREVAIKLLPPGFAARGDRLRFEREARAASALNHPNILTIYEIGQMDDHRFIVAEFIDGETLRQRMRRVRLGLTDVLDIAIQIASALSAAHAAGIVHRDIKPENIMLRQDALVKVLDFGLAKVAESEETTTNPEEPTREWFQTDAGVVLGTSAYMSPEQTRGLPVDPRTDIWSLGVVLYEMIAGNVPFGGATRSDVIVSILEREPPTLIDAAPEHASALKSILYKALRKDKEERYQTATAMLEDLRSLRQELHSQARPASSLESERLKTKKHGGAIAVLLVVMVIAGGALALYEVRGRLQANTVLPAISVLPFTTFPGRELQPAFSADGNQIAFAWNGEKGDNFDIYVKRVDNSGSPPLRITTDPADDLYPAWSPDGSQIAFVRQSGPEISIFTVPALGGPEHKLYKGTSAFFSLYEYGNALSWSPDGKLLAFSGQRTSQEPNSIFLLSLNSLQTRQLTTPPAGFLGDSTPAFSPDGKVLAFVRGASSRDVEIYVMPSTGGEARRLAHDNRSGRSLAWTADSLELVFPTLYSGSLRLWRAAISGGGPGQLAVSGEGASTLAISRRGDRLAYSQEFRDTNIWQISLDPSASNRRQTRIVSSTRQDYGPQYSPDGKKIAFTSGRSGCNEIWVSDADGANPVELTSFGGPDVGSSRWSPDGKQIAFDSIAAGNRDIFVISADGGNARRLTEEAADDVRPSWSKDGLWIYFGSNRSGEWQLWKEPSDGGGAVQLTRQGAREGWGSSDGQFVYYTKGFGIPGIWRVPVTGGEEKQILDDAIQGFWALLDNGIYFVNPKSTPHPTIEFFNFATGHRTRIATVEKDLQLVYPSLAVSPDGRSLLYVQVDSFESDIMLAENFR
jgi:Tol biopolymer transport system component